MTVSRDANPARYMTDPASLYAQLVATYNQGRWQEAQTLATQLLPFAARHAGVHSITGMICLELGQSAQAVDHLRRAAELDPSRADFATMLAKALLANHLHGEAQQEADRAMELQPRDPMMLDALGMVYVQTKAHDRAVTAFRRAASHAPEVAGHRLNLATSLVATGDTVTAERELETGIELDPCCWHAHLLLAQLRPQTIEGNHLERLERLLAKHWCDATASLCVNLAIAKELEDLGRYAEAFAHTTQGKAAGRRMRPYASQRDQSLFEALMQAFPHVAAEPPAGDSSNEPIFIMGMPRSGTTLLERMLSSHPDVHSAGELQNFAVALQQCSGESKPFLLGSDLPGRVRALDWKQLGARYLASTRPETSHKPHFIDKMPHNFLYAGFIANALPRAKIICMRRHPLDTCLGNFQQFFAHPSIHFDYSYDLLDTGRYFVLFDRLMAHWKRAFPGRILEVGYESLVDLPEGTVRELLAYCGLPWDQACLHFERSPLPVATLSSQQVRRPVFRSSIGRWQHYASELAGLRHLLQSAGLATDTRPPHPQAIG